MNRSRRGAVRFRLLRSILILALVLVLAAPYLSSVPALRATLLRASLPKIDGTLHVGGASLGWFSPVRYRDVEIFAADGSRVLRVGSFEGDRPLWQVAIHPFSPGNFRLQQSELDLVVTERGTTNLAEVFVIPPYFHNKVQLGLQAEDALLLFTGRHARQPWRIQPINVNLELQPAGDSPDRGSLVFQAGKLLNRVPLTPEMCADLVQYVLPVVADTTKVSGEFTLELDGWRMPLHDAARSAGTGRLVVHRIDVEPGPIARRLAELLHLSPTIHLSRDSTVRFEMLDGRFYHRDLVFELGHFRVRTEGSVGIDSSLAMRAEITVQSDRPPRGAIAEALRSQTLIMPIGGTLSRPKIDMPALRASGREIIRNTIEEVVKPHSSDGPSLLERLKAKLPSRSDQRVPPP